MLRSCPPTISTWALIVISEHYQLDVGVGPEFGIYLVVEMALPITLKVFAEMGDLRSSMPASCPSARFLETAHLQAVNNFLLVYSGIKKVQDAAQLSLATGQ